MKSIAICGETGSGKTAISYYLINNFNKKIYAYKHPDIKILNERGFKQLHSLAEIEKLKDCVIWIDEPQLYFTVYEKRSNVILLRLLSLCRQRHICLIISTSDTRFITRGLESYIDLWILKDIEYSLVKQGSMIKKIIQNNCFLDVDGFELSINEYIFHSRRFKDFNGKHTFEKPVYFTERYSKPYLFYFTETAKETPIRSAKVSARHNES